ncbi:MAG TPA: IS1595 family transposase, partial [Stellaceae bacterium]|nr:IS1595 family transposase [Stellaceae bacterium]
MVGRSALSAPFFHDVEAAYAKLESILWPHGPMCPRCGCLDRITDVRGKTARMGLRYCGHCKRQFTVTVGTVFERSKVPLNLWLQAAHLLCSSKKGMSSHQIHRILGVQYNTAWFMTMRLREAMRDGKFIPLGGDDKVVETDTTWVGGKEKNKHKSKRTNKGRGAVGKEAAFSLIERDGRVRSFHLPEVNAKTLRPILKAQIDERSYLMTDDGGEYRRLGVEFAGHGTVNHSAGEYVRTGGFHHTNTIENYFSILKRGITGTYHHVSQQ